MFGQFGNMSYARGVVVVSMLIRSKAQVKRKASTDRSRLGRVGVVRIG